MAASLLLLAALGQSPDFDSDVLPVLTKAGCNAAACHGSAAGRGGFHLSLFAGDPAADHQAVVYELEGRRVNVARPEESLLLLKPTEQLSHGGGERLALDGPRAQLIQQWIAAGARRDADTQLSSLQVTASPSHVDAVPAEVRLQVLATINGSRRDVTDLAVYESADPASLSVSPEGVADVRRRGRHVVVVRFMDAVRTVQVAAPLSTQPIEVPESARGNWIDDLVLQQLAELRIPLSPQADDAELLRRVHLDLVGRLPTLERAETYFSDQRPDKYVRLVDELLRCDDFVDYWAFRLAVQLRIRPKGPDRAGTAAFHDWLRTALRQERGWDEMARDMVTANGDTHQVGPANFYLVGPGPREQAEYFSEALMGVRLRCANCHNHPLDVWTQDDYHGLAAVFAKVERTRVVQTLPGGEVVHPRTGQPAAAQLPGGERLPASRADHRPALAQWLVAGDNPFFARNMVNRLWSAMMGRGLIEPVDDLRATNPASHPELLDRLAEDFVEHGCRLRHALRQIALSAAYARSSRAAGDNAEDDRYYSHALVKPLAPEVLLDAIGDVTGVAESFDKSPAGTRAVQLIDPDTPSPALDLLGRCPRDGTCVAPAALPRGLRARLHLINGAVVNRKVAAGDGRLNGRIDAGADDGEVVREFYLRALSRPPSPAEWEHWQRELQGADARQRRERMEDFLWSLLNCREFSTNH